MFRSTVAVLMSCTLLTITCHQYMGIPGHQIDQEESILERALPLREGSLNLGSRELALMTETSSVLVVAVAIIESLAIRRSEVRIANTGH